MQWKDVDRPTLTRICKSAINWLDYGHSFSGIQTDCLYYAICILERQLLVTIMQNVDSTYSMSSSRNIVESCRLGVWLLTTMNHSTSHWLLCNCEFVQLNHSAYSPDLAAFDYFLIRNLKYHLRGTWFADDEYLIAVEAWFKSHTQHTHTHTPV